MKGLSEWKDDMDNSDRIELSWIFVLQVKLDWKFKALMKIIKYLKSQVGAIEVLITWLHVPLQAFTLFKKLVQFTYVCKFVNIFVAYSLSFICVFHSYFSVIFQIIIFLILLFILPDIYRSYFLCNTSTSYGNSQDAPLQMNGLRKCGIYTQWNSTQPWRRMKSYHSQANGWNWRTSFWASLAGLRNQKSHVLPHMQTLDQGQIQQCDWTLVTWSGKNTQGRYWHR
jgi:hypothetical protein